MSDKVNNIASFSLLSDHRLTEQEFYDHAKKNGRIDKIAGEFEQYRELNNAKIDFQKRSWKKSGDFKTDGPYYYDDYLRMRCFRKHDCATPLELANAKLRFKETPRFHDNGNPRSGILDGDQVYEGIRQDNGSYIKLKGSEYIMFFSNGKLLSAILAEDCVIKGLYCKAGTKIEFFENGRIRKYTPVKNINITLETIPQKDEKVATETDIIKAGFEVEYYEGGRIKSYVSAKTNKMVTLENNGNSH